MRAAYLCFIKWLLTYLDDLVFGAYEIGVELIPQIISDRPSPLGIRPLTTQ